MRKQARRLLAGVAVAGMATAGSWSNAVEAATTSANVAVSASVAANCLLTAGSVSFGAYDPLVTHDTANLDASGTFTVRCTRGVTAQVGLGDGLYYSSGRRMEVGGGGNYLNYQLYSDNTRSAVWNNTTGRVAYTATNKSPQTLTIYGRMPGGQDPVTGSYADMVEVIAEF